MEGKMIVLEGIDGAGKATQANLLKEKFEKAGKQVSMYSYPDYSSVYGERIKSFLYKKITLNVEELFFLYLIDMIKDKKRMMEDIHSGKYLIVDRFFFSTIAYQSAGGFDYSRAKQIIKLIDLPVPYKIFYINVPVEVSMQRKEKQNGKMDVDKCESNKAFLSKVSEFYKKLKNERFYSESWEEIDGTQNIELINDLIVKNINLV